MDQEAIRMTVWQSFPQLLQRPFGGRVGGDVVVERPAGTLRIARYEMLQASDFDPYRVFADHNS